MGKLLARIDDAIVDFVEWQCHRLQLWTGLNNFLIARFAILVGYLGFAAFSVLLFGVLAYLMLPFLINMWVRSTMVNYIIEEEALKHLRRGLKNPFRLVLTRSRILWMAVTFFLLVFITAAAVFPLWLWLIGVLESCTPLPPAQDKKWYRDWKAARARAKERQAPVGLPVPA